MEFLAIFLMIFVSFIFLCYSFRNKNGLPTNWPVVGMLFALLVNVHRAHDWITKTLEKVDMNILFKGPWLANMNMFVTLDPANVHYILSRNFNNYHKGPVFKEMFDVLGDGLINVDSDLWKFHRKMAHALLGHPKFHRFLHDKIWEKVEKGLIPVLDHASKQGLVIDLQDLFSRFFLDTIWILVVGWDLGSLSIDWPNVPVANALIDAEEAVFYRHIVPTCVWNFFRWLGVGNERKYKKAWETLDDSIYKCIAKKREENKQGSMKPQVGVDLLTLYMDESQSLNVTTRSSDEFLRDTILSYVVAGLDTSSTTLSWFFYLLSKNPRVESKIRDEINTMETTHDYHKLIYVHGALCEALRLYPPVPFERKASIESDVLPSGHQIDPNMQIIFHLYAMGRMKAIWGEDCYEFKPERWISERGKIRHEPSYKFLAFNAGPRTCLGKDMSFFQMKAIIATIFRNYTFQLVEGHQVVPDISLILRMKYGFLVKVLRSP